MSTTTREITKEHPEVGVVLDVTQEDAEWLKSKVQDLGPDVTASTMTSELDHGFSAKLLGLNNAQLGSFGELLFGELAENAGMGTVTATRREQTDFIVGGVRVDVKSSTRDLSKPFRALRPYKLARATGVSYAQVEFGQEGARVSLENDIINLVPWQDWVAFWDAWNAGRPVRETRKAQGDIGPIRAQVVSYFADLGYRARVIYRTTQAQFGSEGPGNLVPTTNKHTHVTVFLDFNDGRLEKVNVRRVIAFPDTAAPRLPIAVPSRLHKRKVLLDALPASFISQHRRPTYSSSGN